MNKFRYCCLLLAIILLSTGSFSLFAQVYTGNLTLTSQSQVNTFNYTEITGDLIIEEESEQAIDNLLPLRRLNRVGGNLILRNNKDISLSWLHDLHFVGGNLEIHKSDVDLSGLYNIINVTGSFIVRNSSIGLKRQDNTEPEYYYYMRLDSIGVDMIIDSSSVNGEEFVYFHYIGRNMEISNTSISTLTGFYPMRYIGGDITFKNNYNLTSFCGLYRLFTEGYVGGDFITSGNPVNPSKQNVIDEGLCPTRIEGDITLRTQAQIDAFNNHTVTGAVTIEEDTPGAITNLHGLIKLRSCGGIIVQNNAALETLTGFDSTRVISFEGEMIVYPDKGITIKNNASLKNLNGLNRIVTMGYTRPANTVYGGDVLIEGNPMLTSLEGLSNLVHMGTMTIINNISLSNFCGLYTLYRSDWGTSSNNISGNAANPTPQEIFNNGPCHTNSTSFIAVMLGKNVDPPVLTDGSGGAMFVLNPRKDTLHYWIRTCELKCPVTAVQLYVRYGNNINESKVLDITPNIIIQPGSNDFYVHGIWTSSDRIAFDYDKQWYLENNRMYVIVKTTGYPSGEIAGTLHNNVPVHLFANLDGSQEVPPVNTQGSGEGWFTLSGDGDSLYYNVRAYDLTSPVTAAHFHKAGVDSSGPPVKPISFMGDSLSEGWWTNMDAKPLTPELVADLLGCYLYVNVHTSNNPAGEIRGQLYKTDEVPTSFMTLLAARNDENPDNYSKLSFYTLAEGKEFMEDEGDITGYDGQKNIVDMTIDIGGNVYLLNNSWTSMLYRIRPEQFDFNEETVLRAKQMGRLRTSPDDTYKWMTNIQFIKGKLYGFDSKTNKLYNINPNNAHVTEIAELSSIGTGTAGFALGADGNVYLLKNIDEKRSEIWKFNKFPSTELTLVTEVPSLGKLKTLSSHPNGNLYATCTENLYEINLSNKTIGVLKDHKITASAMDFDYFTEKQTASTGTIGFTNLDGVTAVGDFTEVPKSYELSQNYPNPFNPSTTIKYALPEASFVKLVVYNSLGETVKTMINENKNAGEYEIVFNAAGLPSGVYIARIEAGNFVSSNKMILLK